MKVKRKGWRKKKVKDRKKHFKMDLQIFAEDGQAAESVDGSGQQTSSTTQATVQNTQQTATVQTQQTGRSYSDDEIKRIQGDASKMAQRELLKRMGITDGKNADALFGKIKAFVAEQKTPDEEASEKIQAAEERAVKAEAKVEALIAGVKPDCLDDMITIAASRAAAGTALKDVFVELKKKYPMNFTDGGATGQDGSNVNDDSTGNPVGNGGDGNKGGKPKESYGAMLAKEARAGAKKKSFFVH